MKAVHVGSVFVRLVWALRKTQLCADVALSYAELFSYALTQSMWTNPVIPS